MSSKEYDPDKINIVFYSTDQCPWCPGTFKVFNEKVLPKLGDPSEFNVMNRKLDDVQNGVKWTKEAQDNGCYMVPCFEVEGQAATRGPPKRLDEFIKNMEQAIAEARYKKR